MGNNRGTGILAKRLKGRVKISHGPIKSRFWSLDPTDHDLTGPHCTDTSIVYLITFTMSPDVYTSLQLEKRKDLHT